MSSKDPLRFMEAAYTFGDDEQTWLASIVRELLPYELGGGVAAYTSELGPEIKLRSIVNETQIGSESVHAMVRVLPPHFYRRIHAPMPLSYSIESFPRMARELGMSGEQWPHGVEERTPAAAWAICGGDANVESLLAVFHCRPGERHHERDRAILDCFAAHLGSALRLRALLAHGRASADDAAVDAVISPDGRLLDARGDEAKDVDARAPLLDAVRRSERAKLRRASAEERLEIWTALVDGRWSILESTERDGKRMLLAYRNDATSRTPAIRQLTKREQAIAQYASLGHPLKYIAYELGIPLSTVGASLDRALRKLGVASRAELIQLFAHAPRAG